MRARFSSAIPRPPRFPRSLRAFTLAEVLAALLFMAIVIPVAMQGVTVASRAGILSQRKTQAIRIAERVLDETIATNDLASATSSGTAEEGDTAFSYTVTSTAWSEDPMTEVTVRVTFEVQGESYDIALTSLYDPAAGSAASDSGTGTGA